MGVPQDTPSIPLKSEGLSILDTQALHLVGHNFCHVKSCPAIGIMLVLINTDIATNTTLNASCYTAHEQNSCVACLFA